MELSQALNNIKRLKSNFAHDEIKCIREHKDEAIPVLLEYLRNVADNPDKFPDDFEAFDDQTYAMFLLAEFKVHEAFESYIKILEFNEEACDWLLADKLNDDFPAMIASVAHLDDVDRIRAVIENRNIYEFQRMAGLTALVNMYVEGVYPRNSLFAYLGFLLDNFTDNRTFITNVAVTCSDVYAIEYFPRIREIFAKKLADLTIIDLKAFDEHRSYDNGYSLDESSALDDLRENNTITITDTVTSMSWWSFFNDSPIAKQMAAAKAASDTTPVKKKIGRNDPCPCGSGMKYKKCCLGKL